MLFFDTNIPAWCLKFVIMAHILHTSSFPKAKLLINLHIRIFLWTTLQCVILLKIEQLRPGWLFIPSATEFKYTKDILYESWWGKYIMSILKWALKFKTMKLNRQKGYSIWFKFSHLWYIIKCWYLKHLELSVYHSNPRRWSNI